MMVGACSPIDGHHLLKERQHLISKNQNFVYKVNSFLSD